MKMKIELTSHTGERKTLNVADAATARLFIQEYPKRLPSDVRIKVQCDALNVDGWLQGQA
jgi:hypothetical protein